MTALSGHEPQIKISIPAAASRLLGALRRAGFEAYVVGGCVRDSLLGRTPGDWDICTSARPEQVNPMKRFWAFIAACLFLLLTACGGSTSTTEPVWQAELPNTGITVQVSGCTLEEKTASYWANPGAAGEPQSIMELYATDSAPLLEIAAPKAQVDIQFVQPVAGGMAAYDLALPVEQVDMVFLTQPEDNSTRVRFDTIYNFIVTVTSGDQIDQFLIICARNGYGSVE